MPGGFLKKLGTASWAITGTFVAVARVCAFSGEKATQTAAASTRARFMRPTLPQRADAAKTISRRGPRFAPDPERKKERSERIRRPLMDGCVRRASRGGKWREIRNTSALTDADAFVFRISRHFLSRPQAGAHASVRW